VKTIPELNVRTRHVVVDPGIQEHNTFPPGKINLSLTDIVLETTNGNHILTYYYMIDK